MRKIENYKNIKELIKLELLEFSKIHNKRITLVEFLRFRQDRPMISRFHAVFKSELFARWLSDIGICYKIYTPKTYIIRECNYCNKKFNSPINEKKRRFCSRSCGQLNIRTNYNRLHNIPLIKICPNCSIEVNRVKAKYCSTLCEMEYRMKQVEIGETLVHNQIHHGKKFNGVRINAKCYKLLINPIKKCENCGYVKHVDVCHIKPIYTFDIRSKLFEVNHITNLIYLCKNCHREFDYGDWKLEDIGKDI